MISNEMWFKIVMGSACCFCGLFLFIGSFLWFNPEAIYFEYTYETRVTAITMIDLSIILILAAMLFGVQHDEIEN
jgi:hypothetical protein